MKETRDCLISWMKIMSTKREKGTGFGKAYFEEGKSSVLELTQGCNCKSRRPDLPECPESACDGRKSA